MVSNNRCLYLLLFALLTGLASSTSISADVFQSHGSTGRTLLQATAACSVDFEHQNYTIITSQCKGPNYQAKPCCTALKQFACPFADQINDLKSDCATTMFSYINIYGKYPPALFSSLCIEGKDGLACAPEDKEQKNGASPTQFPVLIVTAGLVLSLFKLF